MKRQLTVQESRHKFARDGRHGKPGTIHHAYRGGMEDQLGALCRPMVGTLCRSRCCVSGW
ncbi:hypothetical protein AB0F82_17095 [Streptomyces virginiae]